MNLEEVISYMDTTTKKRKAPSKKPNDIRRYLRGIQIDNAEVQSVCDGQWLVVSQSNSRRSYTVKRKLYKCMQNRCQSEAPPCMHQYTCDCWDKANPCKHIYKVHALDMPNDNECIDVLDHMIGKFVIINNEQII